MYSRNIALTNTWNKINYIYINVLVQVLVLFSYLYLLNSHAYYIYCRNSKHYISIVLFYKGCLCTRTKKMIKLKCDMHVYIWPFFREKLLSSMFVLVMDSTTSSFITWHSILPVLLSSNHRAVHYCGKHAMPCITQSRLRLWPWQPCCFGSANKNSASNGFSHT